MNLATRLQDLPPELFNRVHDLTFRPEEGYVYIDKYHKPPSALQVDRKSRQIFAKLYYNNTNFYFQGQPEQSIELSQKWLSSMTSEHSTELRRVHIGIEMKLAHNTCGVEYAIEDVTRFRLIKLKYEDFLWWKDLHLRNNVLRLKMVYDCCMSKGWGVLNASIPFRSNDTE